MRRTKIIATLGPATDDADILAKLFEAGVDVVRINFSHGSREDHVRQIAMVREVSNRLGRQVAIIADLQGPKVRIRQFPEGSIELSEGQPFALDESLDALAGTASEVGVAYVGLADDLVPGDTLLLDDGQIVLSVEAVSGKRIECKVVVGGELRSRKGINRLGGGLSAPALTDKDFEDLKFAAAQQGVKTKTINIRW